MLGKSYFSINLYEDSIFWLESVVSSTNQSVVAGDVTNPPFLVEAVKLLHDSYLKTNDYKSALSLAQNVAVSLPESALGHTWMGDALLDLDRPSEAIVFYKIAVHVDEEECFAWMGLGKAYLSVEDVQSAAYCLKKAISLLQTKPQNSALVSKNLPVLTFEYGKVLLKIAADIEEAVNRAEEEEEEEVPMEHPIADASSSASTGGSNAIAERTSSKSTTLVGPVSEESTRKDNRPDVALRSTGTRRLRRHSLRPPRNKMFRNTFNVERVLEDLSLLSYPRESNSAAQDNSKNISDILDNGLTPHDLGPRRGPPSSGGPEGGGVSESGERQEQRMSGVQRHR